MPEKKGKNIAGQSGKTGVLLKGGGSRTWRNKVSSIVLSPSFNVIALALLLISVFGGIRVLNARRPRAQVKFVENTRTGPFETEEVNGRDMAPPEIFQGEVYDTAIRLRETGALGMAISLAVFGEVPETGRMPGRLETVWRSVERRNLMPPGLSMDGGGLASETSVFLVRFQSQPFRFEIISSPKGSSRSQSIMMRFPLRPLDGRTITYFRSSAAGNVPAPFAPLETLLASGWKIERWRGEPALGGEKALGILAKEKQLLRDLEGTRKKR